MEKKLAPVVKRDGKVYLGKECIGSVLNTIAGWMIFRADGSPVQYTYWAKRADAVEYLRQRATNFVNA